MGASFHEDDRLAQRQLLAPNIATRSLTGFSARSAGRRPCGRRSRVKPGVSGRNDLKRREFAASGDLHQGLTGRLVLGGKGHSLSHYRVANGPEAPAPPRNHSAAHRGIISRG